MDALAAIGVELGTNELFLIALLAAIASSAILMLQYKRSAYSRALARANAEADELAKSPRTFTAAE